MEIEENNIASCDWKKKKLKTIKKLMLKGGNEGQEEIDTTQSWLISSAVA